MLTKDFYFIPSRAMAQNNADGKSDYPQGAANNTDYKFE